MTHFCYGILDWQDVKDKISAFLLDIRFWMHKRRLKLSDSKTQLTRGALSRAQVSLPDSVDHKAGSALYG